MIGVWAPAVLSVSVISLVSFVGVLTLGLQRKRLEKILLFLVSFAVGALFGDAFIHLLPEAFEELGTGLQTSLYVIIGILAFFVLEKFIRWRHCHHVDHEGHSHPTATINLVGDAMHNLVDGLLIGASYLVSIPVGLATTLAVILHEIPNEIGDFGVLLHSGLPVPKVLLYNFLSALTAIAGVVISLVVGPEIEGYTSVLLPITAGGFIYIAGSDLIPELHGETKPTKSLLQFIAIILGIFVMAALTLVE